MPCILNTTHCGWTSFENLYKVQVGVKLLISAGKTTKKSKTYVLIPCFGPKYHHREIYCRNNGEYLHIGDKKKIRNSLQCRSPNDETVETTGIIIIADLPRRTKQLVSFKIVKTTGTPDLTAISVSENRSFSFVKVDVKSILSVNSREKSLILLQHNADCQMYHSAWRYQFHNLAIYEHI